MLLLCHYRERAVSFALVSKHSSRRQKNEPHTNKPLCGCRLRSDHVSTCVHTQREKRTYTHLHITWWTQAQELKREHRQNSPVCWAGEHRASWKYTTNERASDLSKLASNDISLKNFQPFQQEKITTTTTNYPSQKGTRNSVCIARFSIFIKFCKTREDSFFFFTHMFYFPFYISYVYIFDNSFALHHYRLKSLFIQDWVFFSRCWVFVRSILYFHGNNQLFFRSIAGWMGLLFSFTIFLPTETVFDFLDFVFLVLSFF